LLMLENHSFDQVLGSFKEIYPDLEGVTPGQYSNADETGAPVPQCETPEQQMELDPSHEYPDVQEQLADGNGGFVKNFVKKYADDASYRNSPDGFKKSVMGYYPLGFLPGLHTLANQFRVCDQWFSSLPGPTWPNRFFALSGTSSGHVEMPHGTEPDLDNIFKAQDQDTLFDRLDQGKRSWKIYYYDFPCSLLLTHQRSTLNLSRYYKIGQFLTDTLDEPTFPEFA